jgi:hypothetical protein
MDFTYAAGLGPLDPLLPQAARLNETVTAQSVASSFLDKSMAPDPIAIV